MAMPELVDDDTFTDEVVGLQSPVVLVFFAPWCGNCIRIAPALDALATEFEGRARLLTVNVEDSPQLVDRFEVRSTPTIFVLDGERRLLSVVGVQPAWESTLRALFALAADRSAEDPAPPWVPAEACTLPTAEQPLRLAEFDDLFSSALRSVRRHDETLLVINLDSSPGVEDRAHDLTSREAHCCDFFSFTVRRDADQVVVHIRVPSSRATVLDGLERQARAAALFRTPR